MEEKLLVTILCQTYNQEQFISQALDSFLMQETDFDFDVIVRDDASTDATAKIVKGYAAKYPKIIKPIYELENQMSQGIGLLPGMLPRVMKDRKSRYIALCDGDDYWTDPLKLQKQISFLEENPKFVGSAHASRYLRDGKEAELASRNIHDKDIYTFEEYLGNCYFQTSSWVYRYDTDFRPLIENFFYRKCGGDVYMTLAFMTLGPIKYFDEVMSVWRVHDKGEWSKNSADHQIMEILVAFVDYTYKFDEKYKPKFYEQLYFTIKNISSETFSKLVMENYQSKDIQKIITMLATVIIDSNSPINKIIESREGTIKECNAYIKTLEQLLELEKNKSIIDFLKSKILSLFKR
ncbi:glycosyltransferase [Francisella noatunensis subsp. orientalis]|uniref:Aminotransferase n=2 Tax=Francisella orientalis TaxID=299583 RepID=A0AAP7FTV3_9GAMM|nr:glycosyltransferase [Francisella orientalis]AFJ43291.1 aminotransferase [Francisella orientalis str. Toba 04]AHB98778.1 glycosyl transferase [Francisella orientalis LADL 07-285A]AKN86042.1 Aminotransferase [Francisella orientalis FNO12]AKN87580.1 Aminotransferase [Francisella orientalis FNO24]AKN89118.1 Aminotransferase [Francisella orientalis]